MKPICTLLFVCLYTIISIAQINPDNITIARDKWGVPHIYAKTDAEVAYGLAWATAEDDFNSMQENLLAIHNKLGSVKGTQGALFDFFVFALETKDYVNKNYEAQVSPTFKKVLEGYVQGINKYAEEHPKEVRAKGVFPITPKDVLEGYVLNLTLLSGVHEEIGKIFNRQIRRYEELPKGSNGLAVNGNLTKDGNTYLAVNSHQPLEGPLAWYEAHVESEEGWKMIGANFPGGVSLFVGSTPNLGWTHTVNHPDFCDVYKLEMNPDEKLQYKLDGKWEALEKRVFKTKVKIIGLKIPIKRTIYKSKHGLVFKNKDGFYAVRFPANKTTIKAAEQWFKMNKATNYKEFRAALNWQGIGSTNITYADKEGNILQLGNGHFPYRNPKFNWKKVLPGNISEAIWEDRYYPIDSLAQIFNPKAGYVFNTNNTPFNATAPAENIDSNTFNKTMGYSKVDNNRSLSMQRLMGQYKKMSFEDFKTVKYDISWMPNPSYSFSMSNIEDLFHLDESKYPHIKATIQVLKKWNRQTTIDSYGASIFVLCIQSLYKPIQKESRNKDINVLPESAFVKAIEAAQKHLLKYYKTVRVPLGQLQRHTRGKVSLPISGAPDVLAATYATPIENGQFRAIAGDSYIQLAQFSKDGVKIESINAYGASAREDSPHYTDQMRLFIQHKTKPMTFDKAEIMKNAERVYHPK